MSELYSQRQRSARICASGGVVNSSVLRNSSRNRPLNDSANPFSQGDPGTMYAVLVVVLASHQSRRAWAMNSGPLSLQMNAGAS